VQGRQLVVARHHARVPVHHYDHKHHPAHQSRHDRLASHVDQRVAVHDSDARALHLQRVAVHVHIRSPRGLVPDPALDDDVDNPLVHPDAPRRRVDGVGVAHRDEVDGVVEQADDVGEVGVVAQKRAVPGL
jgi:hypothetical protein